MEETSTSALLIGTPEMLASHPGAVTTTIPREEIEEALVSEPPAELVLEILRNVEGKSEVERRTVKVAWERTDLESVLAADGPAFTFSFDPAELGAALDDAEVEGHGLREAAVVLSIAAAAAVAGTGTAYGQPDPVGGAAQVAVGGHDEATLAERGIGVQPASAHDEAGLTARGIEAGTLAAAHDEAGLTARGIEAGTLAASHDEAGLTARGVEPGTLAAAHDEAGLTARGIEAGTLAASHDEASLTARGIEPGHLAASHDEASLTARGIETGAEPISLDSGSRFDLPSVDPATAAGVAGGLLGAGLLIAAATFATRRREPGTV
jgi:hypothetical protein